MDQPTLPPVDTSNLPDQRPHYVRAVTELGEERQIVAHDDIYAANGMKLLARGATINSSQYEHLNLHKLRAPLDLVLSADDAVNAAHLAADGNRMLANEPAMARIAHRTGDPRGFRQALGALQLPPALQFRLTVMREKRNGLFLHGLRCALISHALAVRLSMSSRQKDELLLAALCHDLGEMYTDPALLEPGHRMTPEERKFIHVHPITGYVLLHQIAGIPNATRQAVLQHHERLDGSGYPLGLVEKDIHPLTRLLSMADVMDAVMRRAEPGRMDVLLRLNQRRFDPAVVAVLHDLLHADVDEAQAGAANPDVTARMTRLVDAFDTWQRLETQPDMQALLTTELRFLRERMDLLRSLMLQAGIEHEDMGALMEMARQDSSLSSELQATLDELGWLVRDIANEIERRTATLASRPTNPTASLIDLLKAAAEN